MKDVFLRKLFVTMSVLLLASVTLMAQRVVKGTIIDGTTNEPLIGAGVQIKGTTTGTVTDIDGNFSLTINSDTDTLQFSFLGYIPQEMIAGTQSTFNVSLSEDITELSEIVVIGYGTQKKEDLTSSIAVVSAEDMVKSNSANLSQALRGKAAGVIVSQGSGMPGSGATIRIRGIGSINAGSDPLYIIDGVEGDINRVSPDEVESMSVLKDASSTAIYGARGANGVIIVKTKRGQKDKVSVSIHSNLGVSYLPKYKHYDVMNADQYASFMEAAYAASGENLHYAYSDSQRLVNGGGSYISTDWQDEISQTASRQSHNVSLSGGTKTSNYFISGNYHNEEGILIGTSYERFRMRATSDFDVTKWLKVGENLLIGRNFTDKESNKTEGNPWVVSTTTSPLMPIYEPDNLGGFAGPVDSTTGPNETTNPVAPQRLNTPLQTSYDIEGSLYSEIKPFSFLTYRIQYGYTYINRKEKTYIPLYFLGTPSRSNTTTRTLTWEHFNLEKQELINTLAANKTFGNHSLEGVLGQSMYYQKTLTNTTIANGIPDDRVQVLSQGTPGQIVASGSESEHRIASLFGRVSYDFKKKYLFQFNIRQDGSSRFGPENRVGVFPSFSLGWKVNDDFLKSVDEINLLKLRGGWGEVGNEQMNGEYAYAEVIEAFKYSQYIFGDDQHMENGATTIWSHGNPLLQWERTRYTNIGFELWAYNQSIQVSADYFLRRQDKMLVRYPVSWEYGKQKEDASPFANIGEVVNQGVDMSITYKKILGAFNYDVSFNGMYVINKATTLPSDILGKTLTTEGRPIGQFYGWVAEGIFQSEEEVAAHAFQQNNTQAGDIRFADLNKDGVINDDDRTIIGNPIPKYTLGLSINAGYKGFDFSVQFSGMYGHELYNEHRARFALATDPRSKDENRLVEALDYWTPENHSTTQTRIAREDPNNNARISTWFVEKGDFTRIQTVQIGYTLPSSISNKLSMSRLRIYVSADNLYTFTKYSGYDPELSNSNPIESGFDTGTYPKPTSFMGGIMLDF